MTISFKDNNHYLSIGNDLVNIAVERSQDKHLDHKFINRILAAEEQLHLKSCIAKSVNLWMFWAGKEAAFKALQRKVSDLIFSHQKFVVYFDFKQVDQAINDQLKDYTIYGIIKYQNIILQSKWEINQNLIHCISVNMINYLPKIYYTDKVKYNIFTIDSTNYKTESFTTKENAKKCLIDYGLPAELEIKRPKINVEGKIKYVPPEIWISGKPSQDLLISLSHDHGWGAIAYIDLRKI